MPYNTRRKSLSLPSLGIHIPMTHAARAALSSKTSSSRPSTSSTASSSPMATTPSSESAPDSQPSKRMKRSHGSTSSSDAVAVEHTPPPSPIRDSASEASNITTPTKVDLETVNDDIVEGVITQLETTANRPHLVKELAMVLGLRLTSVQQSANPCAIISSRLASYMKRPCWSAESPCPLAKELEPVHPRRTYFFLTTITKQPLPTEVMTLAQATNITPSVSLTDDSGSDDVESRRRELSPSPEVDLSPPEFDDLMTDLILPITPQGSFKRRFQPRDPRRDSPPLEKDEREFTQTADVLQKRKLSDALSQHDAMDRSTPAADFSYRDDSWYMDTRSSIASGFLTSPAMKPTVPAGPRKEEESINWLKLNSLIEWDRSAENIEIDELDCLLDTY